MSPENVRVLIIDDTEDQRALVGELQAHAVDCDVCHPGDVTQESLRERDLVLVDYVLDDWREADPAPCLGRDPANGLALTQVLRSHEGSYPTAFALHTGNLPMLAARLPSHQEHLIARLHDLEWVFPKAREKQRLVEQIKSLASAVRELPREWPADAQALTKPVWQLLGMQQTPWAEQAWREVDACQPPLHDLSEHTHGLAFVRWLLHRVLPYPCFLLDRRRLAVRLGVTPTSFETRWQQDAGLRERCTSLQYQGILADFLGPQFWGAAVDQLVWEKTEGRPDRLGQLHHWLAGEGHPLQELAVPYPVLCLDAEFRYQDGAVHSVEDTVQIQPDDWPSYAEQARVPLSLARESAEVKALVSRRERLALDC